MIDVSNLRFFLCRCFIGDDDGADKNGRKKLSRLQSFIISILSERCATKLNQVTSHFFFIHTEVNDTNKKLRNTNGVSERKREKSEFFLTKFQKSIILIH